MGRIVITPESRPFLWLTAGVVEHRLSLTHLGVVWTSLDVPTPSSTLN